MSSTWEEENDYCYTADQMAELDKYFSDIYTDSQIISHHGADELECNYSQEYRATTSPDDFDPDYGYNRQFRIQFPNRLQTMAQYSTHVGSFVRELSDMEKVDEVLIQHPYQISVAILTYGPDLVRTTETLKKEAFADLQFSLLKQSYRIPSDSLKQVVETAALEITKKVKEQYNGTIYDTTMNLIFAIACDNYDRDTHMQNAVEHIEEDYHEQIYHTTEDSSSQCEKDEPLEQQIQTIPAERNQEDGIEDKMETFYQTFRKIEDKKTLEALMSGYFLEADDLTINKVAFDEYQTWENSFMCQTLKVSGILWNRKSTSGGTQRKTLLQMARLARYKRLRMELTIHVRKLNTHARWTTENKGWRFEFKISSFRENSTPNLSAQGSTIFIFYTRKRKLKRMNETRPQGGPL